eukprot:TRINITY_DN2251_c0_g1_i1.p2 TRINITY_DN2251_c0_g1~~TRINITY_DN2251_c0_g1_i1.p2  ORF type:complete len:389 (+),score=141.58 TRINITY_DN2251_c0_g1_i1:69-1235(+)
MAAAPATSTRARRVIRELGQNFQYHSDSRMEISYRGGWQNSTQKLQWFWFGFKKYGFLTNIANMARMREAWWESGEKRLIGMDAVGHKYWETDEMGRKNSCGYRWLDYPYHFQWAEWSKIPKAWNLWAKHVSGRSPPQLEALHKELGPDWRDYLDLTLRSGWGWAERDTFKNPMIMDGTGTGHEGYSSPFHPEFKEYRRAYGHDPRQDQWNPGGHRSLGFKNLYDVDEFDPAGGVRDKLEFEGLSPDQGQALKATENTDDSHHMYNKFDGATMNNWQMRHGHFDKSKKGSEIWWDYRLEQAERTKRSREKVSAFDFASFSSVNEVEAFGYVPREKAHDHKFPDFRAAGFQESYYNAKNHKWAGPAIGQYDGGRVGSFAQQNPVNQHIK